MNSPGHKTGVSILKPVWGRESNGTYAMRSLRGIDLKPQAGSDSCFFKFESQLELLNETPRGGLPDFLSSFGPTDVLLGQSILPVVAWTDGDSVFRCIGTASVVTASGYVMTASHVLLDPMDSGYGEVTRQGNSVAFGSGLNMGVFIRTSVAFSEPALAFFPFEQSWFWGNWKSSPLFHEKDRFETQTDIAICKIPAMPGGFAHQPLSLSVNSFRPGETAYAYGYALMHDIPRTDKGGIARKDYPQLYVSVGEVMSVFPNNHMLKQVSTPGPCFDFKARIPGKMSGGPILGAEGAVVRGVVSKSFSGESHAYGAMLGAVVQLPLGAGVSLKAMMGSAKEGICAIQGSGL